MNDDVARALREDRRFDITTTGRRSGAARRIEIALPQVDGQLYLTGMPGRPRSWYANLRDHPDFTLHVKESTRADLAARATPVLDEPERRRVIAAILRNWKRSPEELEQWVAQSPLVSVQLDEEGTDGR
jgi:deazaflavin-dependent oxidoreductase (nitroreductase family)